MELPKEANGQLWASAYIIAHALRHGLGLMLTHFLEKENEKEKVELQLHQDKELASMGARQV